MQTELTPWDYYRMCKITSYSCRYYEPKDPPRATYQLASCTSSRRRLATSEKQSVHLSRQLSAWGTGHCQDFKEPLLDKQDSLCKLRGEANKSGTYIQSKSIHLEHLMQTDLGHVLSWGGVRGGSEFMSENWRHKCVKDQYNSFSSWSISC